MPILFAFVPAILFEGKPLVAPQLTDTLMGATIIDLKVKSGEEFSRGEVIAVLLDGEEVKEVIARRNGRVKEIKTDRGQRIESGAVIAETRAAPLRVISSMVSALLGTLAFSALTMFYFIRRTNLVEWSLLAAATVLLYWPSLLTNLVGLALSALVYLSQKGRGRHERETAL
jgi:hypothetical protein